jgi:hypothetical protein
MSTYIGGVYKSDSKISSYIGGRLAGLKSSLTTTTKGRRTLGWNALKNLRFDVSSSQQHYESTAVQRFPLSGTYVCVKSAFTVTSWF